jgi:hypothetical protein
MKLVRLIGMCVNETSTEVLIDIPLSDNFLLINFYNKWILHRQYFSNMLWNMPLKRFEKSG